MMLIPDYHLQFTFGCQIRFRSISSDIKNFQTYRVVLGFLKRALAGLRVENHGPVPTLETTELTLYVPLFGTEVNRFSGNPTVAGSSPWSAKNVFMYLQNWTRLKGSPFRFLGFVRLSKNFQCLPRVFFDILQLNGCGKSTKCPPFLHFSALLDFKNSQNSHFSFLFQNFCMHSKGPPFKFLILCGKLDFQKAQKVRPPFTIFAL